MNPPNPTAAQSEATPRTDAGWFYADEAVNKTTECVHIDFARTLERELSQVTASRDAMRKALEKIERWHGEFPPSGRFWLNEPDNEMSYGAAFGSNGERDYMREVARTALSRKEKT